MKIYSLLTVFFLMGITTQLHAQTEAQPEQPEKTELSLITSTAEEGFQLAIQLARKGVSSVQTDRDILFMLRDVYAKDPDALIASSQVVAIHFQTIAAANNYWRDEH